ncbi:MULTISPECIES: muconolactone Delta-isomerase [unclassified Corynebacterium]|uniref:muconolactone Delta-isomerase n=1 Tax=unclassified Corynebacterium TaxID=2624378 RepID=UPI0030AA6025
MALFHVHMKINIPHDMPAEEREKLFAAEREFSQKQQNSGKWPMIWRVAGQFANISVLDVADADELHSIISSLPMFEYMDINVTPLAKHPNDVK